MDKAQQLINNRSKKLPNINTITFFQYLNIKEQFLKISITKLREAYFNERIRKDMGFKNKKEVGEILDFQVKEIKDARLLIQYENDARKKKRGAGDKLR